MTNAEFIEEARATKRAFTAQADYDIWDVTWNSHDGWQEQMRGSEVRNRRQSMDHFRDPTWKLEWLEPHLAPVEHPVDPMLAAMKDLLALVDEYDAHDTIFGSEVKKFAESRMDD